MGRIFTWQELDDGAIPEPENFETVATLMRRALKHEVGVVCAVLFGSVVRGDSNIRSDLDCLVIYDVERERAAMRVIDRLNMKAQELHVPINWVPSDTTLIQTRLHHVGISIQEHLGCAIKDGGLIKGKLFDLVAEATPLREDIESWIKMRMYALQRLRAERTTMNEEKFASFLQKQLESALHVARKMLMYEGKLEGDSKAAVRARYEEVMPRELSYPLSQILELDARYTAAVLELRKNPDYEAYRNVLQGLQDAVYDVLDFIRLNILRLDAAR